MALYKYTGKLRRVFRYAVLCGIQILLTHTIHAQQPADAGTQKWMQLLQSAASDSSMQSIPVATAAQQLQAAAGKKAAIASLGAGTQLLNDTVLLYTIQQSTLIVNMAYKKTEAGREVVRSNPATAYVIDASGICVTNYHVVKEYSSNTLYSSLSVMTISGKWYPVTNILSASESDDLAIIQVDTKGEQLVPLRLGNYVEPNTPVYIISHLQPHFYYPTTGMVVNYKTDSLFNKFCMVMSITAAFAVGSSGGAVIDQYGNIVATISRIYNNEKLAVPVSELKKLITGNTDGTD